MAERVANAFAQRLEGFLAIRPETGHRKTLCASDFAADDGKSISKGGTRLVMPWRSETLKRIRLLRRVPSDVLMDNSASRRFGADDGLIGPSAAAFDTQVITGFAESHFERPALNEPADEMARTADEIGAQ